MVGFERLVEWNIAIYVLEGSNCVRDDPSVEKKQMIKLTYIQTVWAMNIGLMV